MQLDSTHILALNKLIPKKDVDAARLAMDEEGEDFDVDFTIHVAGHLSVGPVSSGNQVNKLCPQRLLMAALNKLNAASVNTIIKNALAKHDPYFKMPIFTLNRKYFRLLLKSGYATEFSIFNLIKLGDIDPKLIWWIMLDR